MTRFQKALGILLSLCFFTILTIVPEPVFTGKNVYRHLPLYRFLEKKSREIDQYGDQKTYEAIASENGKYLRQKAKEEQTSISEKEKNKNSKRSRKQRNRKPRRLKKRILPGRLFQQQFLIRQLICLLIYWLTMIICWDSFIL